MSEKVTFRELIESIAEETDHSKQFTHDFLKDFAEVINDGLKKDGNVNIAGFGKFKLRRVDEREGFNPQTEEKITIPAHNKVVFKPYKDLRELVNAPYSHLEPELIEEEGSKKKEEEKKEEDNKEDPISTEEQFQEDDFIPTAPPTSPESMSEPESESERQSESEPEADSEPESEETDIEEELEDPFVFDEEEVNFSPDIPLDDSEEDTEKEESDIVEFKGEQEDDSEQEEPDRELEEFIGAAQEAEEREEEPEKDLGEQKEKVEEPEEGKEEAAEAPEEERPDQEEQEAEAAGSPDEEETDEKNKFEESATTAPPFEEDNEKKPLTTPTPSIGGGQRSRKNKISFPVIVAAAFVILLVAVGAWYFSTIPENNTPDMSAQQPVSTSETKSKETGQQGTQQPAQNNQSRQQATTAQQAQQKQAQQNVQAAQAAQETDELSIEEGQTLWSIAEEKYGNPRLWPWIYDTNGSIENPNLIIAGNSLSVPLPSGPQNTLTSSDSTGVAKGYLATYRWYKNNQSPKAKNHLWAATLFHEDIRAIAEMEIDKSDLQYANKARQR